MKDRTSELEKIHRELFSVSLESKYYYLGVAQGISIVYKLIQKHKDMNITSEQWVEIIKTSAAQDEHICGYFNRLIGLDK